MGKVNKASDARQGGGKRKRMVAAADRPGTRVPTELSDFVGATYITDGIEGVSDGQVWRVPGTA